MLLDTAQDFLWILRKRDPRIMLHCAKIADTEKRGFVCVTISTSKPQQQQQHLSNQLTLVVYSTTLLTTYHLP